MVKRVEVAAAVIRHADGRFLLGQRAEGTFYPGYWEFPGGKVEPGETPAEALCRELREELDIEVRTLWPWLMREHHYEHAHVRLHFFEVPDWQGEPQARVHAALAWQRAESLSVGPMLPANGPILRALQLPRLMALTHAAGIGVAAQLAKLDRALAAGLRWVQVREPALSVAERADFAREVLRRCEASGACAILNGSPDEALALGMHGVHLSSAALAQHHARPVEWPTGWVGASCHTREELLHAESIGLDYALLGTVQPSASHPGRPPLGWEAFHTMTRELSLPVFAIGGLAPADLPRAHTAGAHGIACIRAAWPD